MKVFIGCSSFSNLDEKYTKIAYRVATILSKKYDLVVGATNRGLMKEVMDAYLKTDKVVEAVGIKKYEKDLEDIHNKCEIILYDDLHEQLERFSLSDLIVFLPGGYGTFNEIACMLNKKANKLIKCKILFINENGFFDDLIKYLNNLYKENMVLHQDLYETVNSVERLNRLTN